MAWLVLLTDSKQASIKAEIAQAELEIPNALIRLQKLIEEVSMITRDTLLDKDMSVSAASVELFAGCIWGTGVKVYGTNKVLEDVATEYSVALEEKGWSQFNELSFEENSILRFFNRNALITIS